MYACGFCTRNTSKLWTIPCCAASIVHVEACIRTWQGVGVELSGRAISDVAFRSIGQRHCIEALYSNVESLLSTTTRFVHRDAGNVRPAHDGVVHIWTEAMMQILKHHHVIHISHGSKRETAASSSCRISRSAFVGKVRPKLSR